MSREAEVRYHADQEAAKTYPALLETAREAERALRAKQAAHASGVELREAGVALDKAISAVLRAAESAQRATFGVKAYDDRIRRRKGRATPEGARWTDEVNRLRTLREEHRLTGVVRLPRQSAIPG
ncbi:hypothetical protein [Acrocarpospora catenulata]|uniref:hypothetical protein n=1 Tax=Acrocarpospora catenulata TaxID=2836182 RepID=UPI0027E12FC1|nr:hypothetical protein [Acrocarpospora catenulata]